MKIYLICQVWSNTKKNHAGILYLCNQLAIFNADIKVIPLPQFDFRGSRVIYYLLYKLCAIYLFFVTKKDDCVILMEYLLSKSLDQSLISSFLKRYKPTIRIIALPHLVNSLILKHFTVDEIHKRISVVDLVLVLGSSLKSFFCSLGIPSNKVLVTFHYVDTSYYKPEMKLCSSKMKVVVMGNMQRDYNLLFEVISQLSYVDFDVCIGLSKDVEKFSYLTNVNLHSFVSEDALRHIMNEADVSLNIMKDTIGSNVIVTSMAMGLAMVVSDVGSIRDYVDETNGMFCITTSDFVKSLSFLNANRNIVEQMKLKSLAKAKTMSLYEFNSWFNQMVCRDVSSR